MQVAQNAPEINPTWIFKMGLGKDVIHSTKHLYEDEKSTTKAIQVLTQPWPAEKWNIPDEA